MKTTVYVLILVLCSFACDRNNPQVKKETATSVEKIASKYRVDTRASKSALYFEKEQLTSYEYDLINLKNPHPVLIKGKDKYVGFGKLSYAFKVHGPFDEIEFINQSNIKVSCSNGKTNGYITEGNLFLFDYPKVEPRTTKAGVFELTDDSGRRGIYSVLFAVDSSSFVLPMDYYQAIYTADDYSCNMGATWWHLYITAEYFKKDAVGHGYASSNKRYEYYHVQHVKETKLIDIFGCKARVIMATKAKTAIVLSDNGYGLIDIKGTIVVPALFYRYELIGDSVIQFVNPDEILKLNIAGKVI